MDRDGEILGRAARAYAYSIPRPDHVELDFELLWRQAAAAVEDLGAEARRARAIGLSVLCPGLVPLDAKAPRCGRRSSTWTAAAWSRRGRPCGGSGASASWPAAANLPFPGGISLTSALWIRDAEPDLYRRTCFFGHTNTFLARRLTGNWGMDPSNAAFTGLYRTLDADRLGPGADPGPRTWTPDNCPRSCPPPRWSARCSLQPPGSLGIASGTPVVMGAGDTACAALGAGVTEEGDILNSTGTVEVMVLCTSRPRASERYLVRNHALPGRWLIMNILSTGGEAVEWVRRQFYREMEEREFFEEHLPRTLAAGPTPVRMEPYLSGDRTSLRQRRGLLPRPHPGQHPGRLPAGHLRGHRAGDAPALPLL